MDWKTILMIGITALLVFVWLPFVIINFRKAWKETVEKNKKK